MYNCSEAAAALSRRHHRLGGASNTPGFPRRDSEEATTYVTANGEVAIKDLRAAVRPTQQQVWWWRTQAPRWTNVTGRWGGGSRDIGQDALKDGRVPAYMTGCHLDLLCGCQHPQQEEEAVMCLHGTSTFSFFVPGKGWKHVKLEAGEAFVAYRLWFAKFWHFASASEETIRMIVRNGSE